MSMAHGLESRVPLLDKSIVELAATMPADIKFKDGDMKHVFKQIVPSYLPDSILNRKDKMGFPTPLNQWINGEANEFIKEIFSTTKAQSRTFIDNKKVIEGLSTESTYGRKIWGLLSLELWQQEFHDKSSEYRNLV